MPVNGTAVASDGTVVDILGQICQAVDNGHNAVATLVGVALSFAILAFIALALRFVTIRARKTRPMADDWLALAAWLPAAGLCFIVAAAELAQNTLINEALVGVDDPTDRCLIAFEMETNPGWPAQWAVAQGEANATVLAGTVLYTTAVSLVKASILLLYGKIFSVQSMRIAKITGLASIACFWVAFFVPNVVFINLVISDTYSEDDTVRWAVFMLASGAADLALDLALFCVPIYYISKLQITTARKIQCVAIFAIGMVCVVAAIARLVWMVEYYKYSSILAASAAGAATGTDAQLTATQEADFYEKVPVYRLLDIWRSFMLWTFIEPCMSIVACCLPTYRPLVERASKLWSSWTQSKRSRKGDNSYFEVRNGSGREYETVELQPNGPGDRERADGSDQLLALPRL